MTFSINKKFRFREFQVYKDARIFSLDLKRASRDAFPVEETYGLRSQLWRALDSIVLNIAEGSDRGTDKDFAHFLNNAHTSLNEVVACLDLALDVQYFSTTEHAQYLQRAGFIANQLTAFRSTILSKVKGQKSKVSGGFTAIEMLFVIFISTLIMVALMRFSATGFSVSREARLQQQAVEEARLQLERIGKAMREARPSQTGAYPLVEMRPQKIIFYSDVDADETTERIRYELVGTDLERGVVEPSGNPLIYNEADEKVSIVSRSIRNGADPVFTYYNGNYPEDDIPLSPIDLTEVKYIQFYLVVDANESAEPQPIQIRSQVQLRNLKTNLGETVE